MVEVGNPERDILLFDSGSDSLANYASLKLPVNQLNKAFLTHLHADHTGDLITLYPIVQTQDLTVFNITKEVVVARQAKPFDQLPPTPGAQRMVLTPTAVPSPEGGPRRSSRSTTCKQPDR